MVNLDWETARVRTDDTPLGRRPAPLLGLPHDGFINGLLKAKTLINVGFRIWPGVVEISVPTFMALSKVLKPPTFQVLVMSEESRLGREQIEVGFALKQLIQAGVRVFLYLNGSERTLNSLIEKAMLALQTMSDEMEWAKAAQRVTDTMLRKARAGHITGGRVFGYDNVDVVGPSGDRSHVTRRINDTTAAFVRSIFERFAKGADSSRSPKRSTKSRGRVLARSGAAPTGGRRFAPHLQCASHERSSSFADAYRALKLPRVGRT